MEQRLTREKNPDLYEYVQSLLSLSGIDSAPSPPRISASPTLIDPLTKRELTILQLLSKGCSNSDIVSMLHLSIGTVKGYNYQIFSKLKVKNRTQAVAIAKEMRLLD